MKEMTDILVLDLVEKGAGHKFCDALDRIRPSIWTGTLQRNSKVFGSYEQFPEDHTGGRRPVLEDYGSAYRNPQD